jgi:hypothetical protein
VFLMSASIGFAVEPTAPNASEMERMRLENEKMKLENERLKLDIEKIRVESGVVATPEPVVESRKDRKERKKDDILGAMKSKSQELANGNAEDSNQVVLDFNNGDIWYRGVRHSMTDLPEMLEREKWDATRKLVKRNAGGYARYRWVRDNIASERYEHRKRGMFIWEAPKEGVGFAFVTPEGPGNASPYDEFRNAFGNELYEYDKQKKKGKFRIIRFKHRTGFFDFDDKLNFWFDSSDRLVKVEWGVLDEN